MSNLLSQPLGNNTFSYDQRKSLDSDTTLIISDPCNISLLDQVQLGNFVVFEEVDHNGKLHSCTGLTHTYIIKTSGPEIIITDNHNHVLPYWLKLISQSSNQQAQLIHIDQHSDLGPNLNQLDLSQIYNPQYQWDFAHLECNIGNFITPCINSGLISNMIQIRTEYKLSEITNTHTPVSNTSPIIVDIDLDFRAPEMGISSIEKTMSQIRIIMDQADLITIATSPYFIDQTLALNFLHQLIGPRLQSHHSCKTQQ